MWFSDRSKTICLGIFDNCEINFGELPHFQVRRPTKISFSSHMHLHVYPNFITTRVLFYLKINYEVINKLATTIPVYFFMIISKIREKKITRQMLIAVKVNDILL